MANTPVQTGGPTEVDPFMIGQAPEPMTEEQVDAELEKAFGPTGVRPPGTRAEQTPPEPTPDAPEGDTVEQEGVEGDEQVDEGGEPTPEQTQQQTQSQVDYSDFSAAFQATYGRAPTPADIQAQLSLTQWASTLTQDQQAAVDWAIQNPEAYQQYVASQIIGAPPATATQPQPTTQQQPPPTPQPQADVLPEEIADDPALARLYSMFSDRMGQMQAEVQRLTSGSYEQQQQRVISDLSIATQEFAAAHPETVTDMEMNALHSHVTNSQILPGFVQANGGDVRRGMMAALEHVYWQTPTFRDRELAQRQAQLAATQEAQREKARKASKVTGSGGNGASRTDSPPSTVNGRWSAVTEELRQAMNDGQPS